MTTSRRGFLGWALGACALTAAQKAGVVQALEALPPEPETEPEQELEADGVAGLRYADPGPGLYIEEAVDYRWQLPDRGSCEGAARWVSEEDIMVVWVDDMGWLPLMGTETGVFDRPFRLEE